MEPWLPIRSACPTVPGPLRPCTGLGCLDCVVWIGCTHTALWSSTMLRECPQVVASTEQQSWGCWVLVGELDFSLGWSSFVLR